MNIATVSAPSGGTITLDLDDAAALAQYRAQVDAAKPKETGLRLDLGCGTSKRKPDVVNGQECPWTGVDRISFPGVDVVCELGKDPWPWKDGSVEELHASHFVEHLKPAERIHFANEAWRVLKPGGRATIITPNWASCRAYGDLTHEWPPVSEFWFPYLDKEWRKVNAPHNDGYTCDFTHTYGYGLGPTMVGRSQEYISFALQHYKEAAADLSATLTKVVRP